MPYLIDTIIDTTGPMTTYQVRRLWRNNQPARLGRLQAHRGSLLNRCTPARASATNFCSSGSAARHTCAT
jgi:hypothetical protein